MSAFNATALIVDDRDPSVVYSPGWQQSDTTAEFDDTKSGADEVGMTASFKFTGTGIEVYGSMGSWDVYGVPVSDYTIDGGDPTTYTAPVIAPPFFEARILFYRSPLLKSGEHTLVITNKNGTSPCVYWLDYIVYTPVVATAVLPSNPVTHSNGPTVQASSLTSSSTTAATILSTNNPASVSSQQGQPQQSSISEPASQSLTSPASSSTQAATDLVSAILATSTGQNSTLSDGFTAVTSASSTSSSLVEPSQSVVGSNATVKPSSTSAPVGAIAGAVVGGVAILALFAVCLSLYRRQNRLQSGRDVSPFAFAPGSSASSSETPFTAQLPFAQHGTHEKPRTSRAVTSGSSFASPGEFMTNHDPSFASHTPPQDMVPMSSAAEPSYSGEDTFTGPNNQEFIASARAASTSDPRVIHAKLRAMHTRAASHSTSRTPFVQHHEDSGMRMLSPQHQPTVVDIPPAYSTN